MTITKSPVFWKNKKWEDSGQNSVTLVQALYKYKGKPELQIYKPTLQTDIRYQVLFLIEF